jgi:hypothetical protein
MRSLLNALCFDAGVETLGAVSVVYGGVIHPCPDPTLLGQIGMAAHWPALGVIELAGFVWPPASELPVVYLVPLQFLVWLAAWLAVAKVVRYARNRRTG